MSKSDNDDPDDPDDNSPMRFFKPADDPPDEEGAEPTEELNLFDQILKENGYDNLADEDELIFEKECPTHPRLTKPSELIESLDFEKSVKKEDEFPLNIPGVKFKPMDGSDVVLEHAEDYYKPPVKVKLTLPEGEKGSSDGIEQTAIQAFGLKGERVRDKMIADLLAPLEGMAGLDSIKTHIAAMVRLALITQMRQKAGLPVYPLGGHMLFLGNPGTGKTHVARLLASILYKAGILEHGHLIEVDRAALTGEYIGWSESKTNLVCNAAQGGMLFIDEAYALSDSDSGRDFGYEAINVLNKRMEDDAHRFVVIAAGYKNQMENFLRSNPGLRSRFQHRIDFRDYTTSEMVKIFNSLCRDYHYKPDKAAKEKLATILQSIRGVERDRFGNARGVRNLFEKTLANQSKRLIRAKGMITPRKMRQLTAADIPASKIVQADNIAYLPTTDQ